MNFIAKLTTAEATQYFYSLLWVCLSLGSIHAIIILYQGSMVLSYPYATTRIESFILNGAVRFSQGLPIYLGFDDNKYIIHVYNPLSYLPAGGVGKLFNLNLEGVLLVGRLMSYLSTLFLASILTVWVRHKTGNWKYGLFVGFGIFFFQQFTTIDFFRFRPEPVALFFTFAGVLAYLSDTKNKIYISCTLLFIAFLFKQPFIAAPFAVLIHLLVIKNYYSAVNFCVTMVGLLAFYFGITYIVTDGHFIDNAYIAMASNKISPIDNLKIYFPLYFERSYALILAPPFAFIALLRLWPKYRFLIIYFIVITIWTFISAGKSGAGDNYFSEITILSLVLIAFAMAESERNKKFVLIALLAIFSSQVISDLLLEGMTTPTMKVHFENGGAEIAPYVKRYCINAENTLILHEKIAVHCGDPVGLDWYLMDLLDNRELIDLSPLYLKVMNGGYERIIFDQQPHSQFAVKVFGLAKNGVYQRKYSDNVVSEWVLISRE